MQLTSKFTNGDLPPEVLEGLEAVSDKLAEDLVASVCQRYLKDKLVLTVQDQIKLKDMILEKINYNVSITADVKLETLEEKGIVPVPKNQATFEVFLEEPEEKIPDPAAPYTEEEISWHRT